MAEKLEIYLRFESGLETMEEVEFFSFPAGEIQMKEPDIIGLKNSVSSYVVLRSTDVEDILKARLWSRYFQAETSNGVDLFVPYFPAGRSDKGSTEAVSTYVDLIYGGYAFDNVVTLDKHNPLDTKVARIKNVEATDAVVAAVLHNDYDAVIAPDAGAKERAGAVAKRLGLPLYVAQKERNQETGEIISYSIDVSDKLSHALVVDDICDGGATFISLAEKLVDSVWKMDLWVTHGIFSKGVYVVADHYNHIYSTDSVIGNKGHYKLTQLPVMPFIRN